MWLVLLALLLFGSQLVSAEPPQPVYLPVVQTAQAARYTYYLPLFYRAPQITRLGLAGGTPAQVQALGGDWLYDWSPYPAGSAAVEAVPMLGNASRVGQALGGSSDWLLTFNEPDLCGGQACISPAAAVALWLRIEALYPYMRLVSPAPSSDNIGWLPEFRAAFHTATGRYPEFQALALHCYEWTAEACIAVGQQFLAWAQAWDVPEVWVTEFAFVEAWAADPEREARAFVGWAEDEPVVTRIAPFTAHLTPGVWFWPDVRACADPSLFVSEDSTQLTALGAWYRR